MPGRNYSAQTSLHISIVFAIMVAGSFFSTDATAATFTVNTTADTQDVLPGNGVCSDSNGMCSLRAAISEANAFAGEDVITLPAGTYTETLNDNDDDSNRGGDFDITSRITINGAGAATTITQADDEPNVSDERVFHLLDGATAVSINGVTIRYGVNRFNDAEGGGGIRLEGATSNLTLNDSNVSNNMSESRGGGLMVATSGAGLAINRCQFTDNRAGSDVSGSNAGGAAIAVDAENRESGSSPTLADINNTVISGNVVQSSRSNTFGGGLIVRAPNAFVRFVGCTISNNASNATGLAEISGFAGGLYNQQAMLLVIDSIVAGNTASHFHAGIRSLSATGADTDTTTVIVNSTVSNNSAAGVSAQGAGVVNFATDRLAQTAIVGSTISGNMLEGLASVGGGVANVSTENATGATMHIINSTIYGNSANNAAGIYNNGSGADLLLWFSNVTSNNARDEGGGIYQGNIGDGGTTLRASIVADNQGLLGPDIRGPIGSDDYNLVENLSGGQFSDRDHDQINVDPRLGTLTNNGGETMTQLPQPGSPVIDTIPLGVHGCGSEIVADQRGFPRPVGGRCDKGAVEFGSAAPTPTFTPTATSTPTATATPTSTATPGGFGTRADFDGDGKTDLSVFRPSDGTWYYEGSSTGFNAVQFGESSDIPAPGDFDNDGRTDISQFRPSNGVWYRLNSSDGTAVYTQFGLAEDIPQAGDYDGDFITDVGVFRPSSATWYWLRSSDAQSAARQFGQSGDRPCVGDYSGDAKVELAVFRGGLWYVMETETGAVHGEAFGLADDAPVPADYDGDGKADIAVFRPSEGNWYFHFSGDGSFGGVHWGQNGDVLVPGDYDGDRRYDVGVYRDGVWYINATTEGAITRQFGLSADIPIPKKYIP